VGRAPRWWTEERVKLVKEHFIAVSVSNYDQGRQDAVGRFVRESGMQFPGAGGSRWFVTASGKLLGRDVKQALKAWQALPASERAPGAVKVPEMGKVDPKRTAPTPPAGALIVKLHYRAFMRDSDGKLRYATGKDLWHDEKGTKTEERMETTYPGSLTTPQAQPDHLWLTEKEWQSLLPVKPRQGQRFAVPAAITDRLCRWHLNPLFVYGEANPLSKKEVRSAEMSLTVERVSSAVVRLRLDGAARLGDGKELPVRTAPVAWQDRWGYDPRLLGYLEYDPTRRVITRFDVVALGDHHGKLGICDSASRPGRQPLGVAFELARPDVPANRIPPGRTIPARDYFRADR
jgi:hypothetical protein